MNKYHAEILESNKKLFMQCFKLWGTTAQTNIAIEEMAELTKELCKYNRGHGNLDCLIDEMVDVLIMLNQLFIIYEVSNDAFGFMLNLKIKRLSERTQKALSTPVESTGNIESEEWDGKT